MNEEEVVQNEENNESEDEDCEEYFLQSTPGPYDIREKIRLANDELFEDFEAYSQIREQKVTFSENLVDYEPDFSSDDGYVRSPDILSVISDNENDSEEITHQEDNDLNLQNNIEDISDSKEEHDIFENKYSDNAICELVDNIDNTVEEDEEDIIIDECEEEVENECVIEEVEDEIDDNSEEQIIEVVEIIQDSPDDEDSITSTTVSSEDCPINVRDEEDPTESSNNTITLDKINCRLHCLEKKEIDFLNGKPKNYDDYLKGPVLKLRRRSCCTNQPCKPKLPTYNGFISEYGMTKSQLERKQRRKEKNVQKKKEKSVRINEEKKQKDLYNEEIFCAWLKSLKNRNQPNNNNNNKENTVKKQRPKTAPLPHCNLSIAINKPKIKRPSTTSGCTFKIMFE